MGNIVYDEGRYGNNTWTIYHGNCIDIIRNRIPNNTIDCIVTSPPYWDCRAYGLRGNKDGNVAKYYYAQKGKALPGEIGNGCTIDKYLCDMKEMMMQSYRVLKYSRFMFINIGVRRKDKELIDISSDIIRLAKEVGFIQRETIIWIKKNALPAGKHKTYYLDSGWEYLLMFSKGKPETINRDAYMKLESHYKCRLCGSENFISKKICPNYFYSFIGCFGSKSRHKIKHPAIFPIEVPEFALRIGTWEGYTVLDPFVGSGTTLIAGLKLKVNVIGCELVPEIYNNLKGYMKDIAGIDGQHRQQI